MPVRTVCFKKSTNPRQALSFEQMVDGWTIFTRRFAGEVWLEVLLLDGRAGTAAEVKKIVQHTRRIHPTRVQLNTVCRPPAGPAASSLTINQLHGLAGLFTAPVDIISHDDDTVVKR